MAVAARSWAGALAVLLAAACESSAEPPDLGDDAGPPDPPERHPGDFVFDPAILHEVRIEVAPEDVAVLENDRERRVPCTFTFDGITLHDVGIRQKGQGTNAGSIYGKPSLSVKFDEFVSGQDLDGLEKLIFDNAAADPTLMNEPIGYALYARAGIPAPRTAHVVITFVGLPAGELVYGVHVMVEAIDTGFLRQAFGAANGDGNLYEDEARGDFGTGPELIDLKDEEQGRTREHLFAVAELLQTASDEELLAELPQHFDLDRAITSFALDLLVVHWDGFWTAAHNYYLYDNPADGRFVLLPHGMDLLFSGYCVPEITAASLLGQRILAIPELRSRLDETRAALLETVWDAAALHAQIDGTTALLDASGHDEPAFANDVRLHHETIERLGQTIDAIGVVADGPAICGNGVLEWEELCAAGCDDGNRVSEDGCSTSCLPEFCGDGIVQPGLGELCDSWECNGTCSGPIVCGDGLVDALETCDDGNDDSEDGCSSECQVEVCGDGIVQPGLGEGCDGEPRCRPDCSEMIPCGDGVIEWPEYCDDGNAIGDDGCTNECEATCVSVPHERWTYDFCLAETSLPLAVAICAHVGSSPVAPRTTEEDEWLRTESQLHAVGPWWLGVERDEAGQWSTSAGGALAIDGWAAGEPAGSGDCAVIDPAAAGWSDRSCEERHPVVCRR